LLALVMGGSMAAPFVASVLAEALPAEAERAAMPEEEPATQPESAVAVLAEDEETDNPDIQPEDTSAAETDDEPESTQEPTTEPSAEPTQEPTAEPTTVPTGEPTTEPTTEPTVEPTTEPTADPTSEPTQEPTPSPTPIIPVGSYVISITPPEKWQTGKATATVKITDQNGTGWAHIKIVLAAPSAWTTVADGDSQEKEYAVTLRENSTIYVSITDHAGNVQSKSEAITCFDDKAPTVRAGISGEMICIEASDEISGVEAVFINGHRLVYKGDALDAKIEDYADGKEKIAVQAVDRAGNFSGTVYVKNPFYGQIEATPRPTKKPSSSGGSTSGGSSGTGSRATPTPRPAATATLVPTPTPIPTVTATPYLQQLPTATAVPSVTVPAIDAGMVADIAEKVLEGMIATPSSGSAFALNGNMKTLDLLYSKATNKQFISVQTKQGQTYYIVIDYDKPVDAEGDLYETYFLNLVDDADLLSVLGNQPTPEPTATPVPTLEPTPTPTPQPTAAPEPEKKDSVPAMMAMLLLTVLIGGGAAALVLFKKKDKPGRVPDIDDLDFDDDNEDDDGDRDAP
ncbi:MAG: DUF4366 domain-containing protein, partial [Candidatus Ventricola sp.]|nr:DUF4366 domain-containing protein [Candidatus Ventricola sp.]